MAEELKNEGFSEIIEDLNLIPVSKFINLYLNRTEDFNNLERALHLTDLLNNFRRSMKKNIEIISQYNEIIDLFITHLRCNFFLNKKDILLKELEIIAEYKNSSSISAISDLLDKLNNSIIDNKKKLKYLEEDYFQRKNQIDQINNTINNYSSQVKDLTKKKKEFFSQINRITREMSGNLIKEKSDKNILPEIDENLTNAQKIKLYQRKAKDVQIEINNLNLKIDETTLKFKEFNPLYEAYKKDYDKLKEIIKTDEKKVQELGNELRSKLLEEKNNTDQTIKGINLKSVRSKQEIEDDLKKTEDELNTISIPENIFNLENPEDLFEIIKKIRDINNNLKTNQNKIRISKENKENGLIFDSFQKLEIIINELELLLNNFLVQINLKSSFRILISEDNQKFFVKIEFTRNNKQRLSFDELTTPEKIFFIIVFYISIELQVKNNTIIFSNLYIPSMYNKAGSIFRTIRKILPLFETEESLSNFSLIFILSNLEMKKEIKNLKIIKIQENG